MLYEVTAKDEYFELSYFLERASYATDMSKRTLLTPGVKETIPFGRSRLVSKMLSKGSRLLVVLNVNKIHLHRLIMVQVKMLATKQLKTQ